MANLVPCTKCENWVHGRYAKIKRATARLAMHFVCLRCIEIIEGTVDLMGKLCHEVEPMIGFCYLGDRLNSSGVCEAAVTARIRIRWVRLSKVESCDLEIRFF